MGPQPTSSPTARSPPAPAPWSSATTRSPRCCAASSTASSAPCGAPAATFCDAAPRLREASRNSARDLLEWTGRGGGLRAVLVVSVGTITLTALTGLLILMSFLLVGTANTIIVSVLMSLAAARGFLALFFACLVAVYVGAVSIATFAISTTVITSIAGVLIATGWLGFFWMIWFAARKSMDLTKHSIGMTSSAIHSYSASRHVNQRKHVD